MQRRPAGGSRSARVVRRPRDADHARRRAVRVGRSRIRFRVRDVPCERRRRFRRIPRGAAVRGRGLGANGDVSAARWRGRRDGAARGVGAGAAGLGSLRGNDVRRVSALAGAAAQLHHAGGATAITRSDRSHRRRGHRPARARGAWELHGLRHAELLVVQERRGAGQGSGCTCRYLCGHVGADARPRLGRPRHAQTGVRFAPLSTRHHRVRRCLRHRRQHGGDRPHDGRRKQARAAQQPVRERELRRGVLLSGRSRSGVRVPVQSGRDLLFDRRGFHGDVELPPYGHRGQTANTEHVHARVPAHDQLRAARAGAARPVRGRLARRGSVEVRRGAGRAELPPRRPRHLHALCHRPRVRRLPVLERDRQLPARDSGGHRQDRRDRGVLAVHPLSRRSVRGFPTPPAGEQRP